MLFDEGIDFDQSQNLSSAAERFYEDIFNPSSMTNEEQWKKISSSVGLPTPPSTPEKCPQRLRNNMKLVDSSVLNMHYYSSPIHQSPNNNLQVVPDTITGDDVQDIIPFLTDLGNRSIASPNFFETNVSQGTCNSQAKQSPPPCTPSDSIVRSPSFQAEQTFTHTGSIFSDCSSEGMNSTVFPTYFVKILDILLRLILLLYFETIKSAFETFTRTRLRALFYSRSFSAPAIASTC